LVPYPEPFDGREGVDGFDGPLPLPGPDGLPVLLGQFGFDVGFVMILYFKELMI
jgi:hypothetical protein